MFQLFDAVIVVVSFFVAWYIKFHSGLLLYGANESLTYYLPVILISIPVFLVSNWVAGMYRPMRSRSFWQESSTIIRSLVIGMLMFMSVLYFIHLAQFPRSVLLIFALIFAVLTYTEHMGARMILRMMRSHGFNRKFLLLVGWTHAVERFVESLEHQPWFGYHIIGCLTDGSAVSHGIPRLGKISDMSEVLSSQLVDHVLISLPRTESDVIPEILGTCEANGIQSLILPDYFDVLPAKPRFETFAGVPLIDTRHVPLDDALNATLKRIFDIVFSVIVLIGLSPLYLVLAILVKLSSRGPVFYRQERVGKNRRMFTMYKFRTMLIFEERPIDGIAEWTVPDDPRRTPIGRFLRKTSLDELPQFWNVLIGNMSVIGPRPERPQFVDRFRDEVPKYMVKHRVRPGITGLAQVNGWRGDTSIVERIKFDIEYIENWTLWMDIRIVFSTVLKGFVNHNAY